MFLLILATILPIAIIFLFHTQKRTRSNVLPPGPRGLPYIGNLLQFDNANPHIYLWKLSQKYGPLMSLKLGSVPVLIVSSPKTAEKVLKTHDLAFCSRPGMSGATKLSYNGLDIGFAPYSESWRELRKISVLHLFSNKQVQSFRPVSEYEVSRMIRNLSVKASTGQVADLSETMVSLTSTFICRVAFGKIYDEEDQEMRRFDEIMIESQAMLGGFFVSDYLPLFGWVDKVSGMKDRLDKNFKDLDEFFQDLIDEKMDPSRPKSPNSGILDLLIQLKEEQSCSIDLTWDHVKAILMDIFGAGTETSATTIVWTMTALMQNPNAMKKLQREIRETVKGKGEIKEEDLRKLPYLKATVKEVLRLYPPAPLLLPRETREQCMIDGYTIPPKTSVFVNAWAIARDPEYWESPNEFLPERFLNSNVDVMGQHFQYIPFGSGRRVCPGISLALATVELALANLLYSFDWELPTGMMKEDIDTEVLPGLGMHKKVPLCLLPKNYVWT